MNSVPDYSDLDALAEEQIARQCAAQGLPLTIEDPQILRRVVDAMMADPRRGS
jgi:hypothetical protein